MNIYSFAFRFTDSFTGCDGEGNWLDQDWWNVETWGCCSSSNPCGVAEGDCDNDDDCQGHLLCGMNNCFFPFPYDAGLPDPGCCYEPFTSK